MKKPTFFKHILAFLFLLFGINSIAQTFEPFTVRKNLEVRGSMLVIGNNTIGQNNLPFNDNTQDNQDISMQYVDIDNDASTFSSSSADIIMPTQNNGSPTTCYRVAYAALYWGAVLQSGSRTGINNVKFKTPESTSYIDISGELIYDAIVNPIIAVTNEPGNTPYACYADVTSLFSGVTDIEGTYSVANVKSSTGLNFSTGLSAGWTLFIIYEDPNLHTKSFTTFDGFSHIFNGHDEVVPVSGFTTPPGGHIDLQFAYAALDGDRTKRATKLEINGKEVTTPLRTANKFFGSVIENTNGVSTPRNPFSSNTLGYDTGSLEIINSEPEFIGNNDTSATFALQVAPGQADPIFAFFTAFAVDVISPNIDLIKIVVDAAGNEINGDDVFLGQNIFYEISYQNTGNDNVTGFTITDILPDNIIFNPLTDIDLTNSGGATLLSYDPVTRTLVFSVPPGSVEVGDPEFVIRLAVRIVPNCYDLSQACSNEIINQAFAAYSGVLSSIVIEEQGSYSTTECFGNPQPTNFLVDISNCNFQKTEILCGASVILTAAAGYDSYSWSTSPTGSPVIATGQTYTATAVGTYYVRNTAAATCISIDEIINVVLYGNTQTNPVIPYADEVVTCPNDGKLLPLIFLCGANDVRNIYTGISDSVSIIWQRLNESSCTAVVDQNCANENSSCTWNQVGTGPNFVANTSGQFRLVINYPGGCFSIFYFNVFQNLLNPTVTAKDIICTTPGSITVGSVPSGYEYSIDGVNYQSGNIFTVNSPGYYVIYIRQTGIDTNPCIFQTPSIYVRQRDFNVTTSVSQPQCNGGLGSIHLAANDALPQYYFSIYESGTLINSVGPIMASDYVFSSLNAGNYTINVSTDDGCFYTEDIIIVEPPLLTVTAALTIPLTCTDGEITVYPVGGTPPYLYYVNSTTDFQSDPEIIVASPGVYNITVVDTNNCSATTTITVDAFSAPEFTISTTDILCSGSANSGNISINVTAANGNSLQYSIDGGATFGSSPVFNGLAAGSYQVVVQYTGGTSVCATNPQTVTITSVAPISGTATLAAPYTCTSSGTINVINVSGGNSPYTYSIDGVNFQTGTSFTGLINGTYTITIQDANACYANTNQITINPLNPPVDLTFANSALTCPSNTTTVTITGTIGGVAPLAYQIIAPASSATAYQSSNVFSGLASGTYTFQVKDANNCTYSESYTIPPLAPITVVGQNINDITCFGAADGSVQYTISGTTNFNYTINGGSSIAGISPVVLTGLTAGTYTIIVTDMTTNCNATASLTVNGPSSALAITTTMTPITCLLNGSVVINASGGWGGNTYSLTLPDGSVLSGQSNNTFVNLTQVGTYTVTVVDANNCTVTTTFDLNATNAPIAIIDVASDLCYDGTNGATIQVSVTSGQAPYEYSINGGAYQTSNIFANLVPGAYTVTVRDAFGCTVVLSTETIAAQLTLNTVLTKDLDCTASPDAVITGTITGGTGPYTYSVSINGGAYNSLGTTTSPFTYSTANSGTYQFQLVGTQGCTAQSGIITINPISPPALSLVTQTQPILCNGDTNGAILITIDTTVGTPPFVINVNNDTTGVNYGTQTSGLPSGAYTITVTDAKSCTATNIVTIGQPDPIDVDYYAVDITCTAGGVSQGSIIINGVTGGTAPYNYFVTGTNGYSESELNSTGSTSVTFDVVDFGLYQINVVDANGCSVLIQNVLVASPPTDLDINISTSVDCITGGIAVVSIGSTLSSAGPFFFSIYLGPISVYPNPPGSWLSEDSPGSQSATFTGLTPGVLYTFIVYDASTNCSYYEPATAPIPTNSSLTATAVSANNITCNGSGDGNVSFTINSVYGSATNITYEIFDSLSIATTGISGTGVVPANGALTISNLGPLPFGNYYVLISETSGSNSGCGIVTAPFNITESAIPLSLTVSVDKNANCNASSGVISAIGHNGTSPYQFQITTTATVPPANDPLWASASTFNLDAGNYYVHVVDAYGCVVSSPAVILPIDPSPVISATVNNQCTAIEGGFEIDVALNTVGILPYSISVDGGAFQTQTLPFTISNLSSGNHTVEVKDLNGCGNLVSVSIEAPLGLTPSVTALPSCSNNDGIITVTESGGTGNYTYAISPNPASISLTGNVFSGVPSGTYTVSITDTVTSCTGNVSVTLDAATPVIFSTTVADVSCDGGNNGVITVNLPSSNDNPVYTYDIIAPVIIPSQNSNVFTGLSAGTYTVQVTSGRGCSATRDVVVGEPQLLQANGTATDFACAIDNSVNTSTLAITGVGGIAPYTYSINGTNYFTSNTFDIIDNGSIQTITIYVKDANGCLASNTVTINPLPALSLATATIATPIDCNNTGTVSLSVTGGSGNFTYQMLPSGTPQASNIFSVTAPGDYYFQVNDVETGCNIATAPFTIAPFESIVADATATVPVTCHGDNNGEMELNVSGYTGNYTYEVLDNTGASVGGTVSANTSTNPQVITGLMAGNYTIIVTETNSPFCSTTSNVVSIDSPPNPLTLSVSETSNVTCDNNQGTISAVAVNGWGNYEYELTGAATVGYSPNGTFTDLSAGNYTVNVMDAGGCIATANITLVVPIPINATFTPSSTLLTCFGNQDASITVSNVSGGQGSNYTYTLNTISPTPSSSGPQTSNVFGGLGQGTYNISINDGYNCEMTSLDIVIAQPTQVMASLATATTQTCLTQATLTLSATGGTGPYTYSNNSSFSPALGSFASSITFSVPVGTHVYNVRDSSGCITNVSNGITVDPLPNLAINLMSTNPTINCAGDNTGVIHATAQGGLGNYIYTLQDTFGNTVAATQNSPGVFTELVAGTYVVSVVSGDCNIASAPINITEPTSPLEATYNVNNVTCTGANNGTLEILASGGTGIIKYAISPQSNQFFDSNIFENLAPGNYDVIVQDVLGCYLTFNFTITEPAPVLINIVANSMYPEVCEGDGLGEFAIEIFGGTAPYSVNLDNYDGTYTTGTLSQTQFEFNGLGGGDHSVFVRDAEGCESEWNITFPESVTINPTAAVEYLCENNASTNTVTVTVDESNTDLSQLDYSLDGGPYQVSNVFMAVAAGVDHYINVRHTNGCIQTTEFFDIIELVPVSLVLNEGNLNEIVAVASGGDGDYVFTFNGEDYGTTNTFIITASGNYTITVTDGSGCTAIATMYLEFVDICIPNYFTPNNDGVLDGWAPGCANNYPNLEFDIFDRYGRKVATYRIGQFWDGKYNGAELPTGDYWYVVRLNSPTNNRDFVGHFTLYR